MSEPPRRSRASEPPSSARPGRISVNPSAAEREAATESARGRRARAPGADIGRPTSEPLYQTAVFDFPSIAASEPAFSGEGYVYARNGRPNLESLELSIAALERAEAALVTASGMTAVLCALLAATKTGDRVLCQRDGYGGTRALFEHDAERLGLTVEYVDVYEPAKVADGLARGARFVLVESLSNPLMREADLAALSWHTRSSGALLCVDNTMATPIFRRPIEQGADLVLHSVTKFLGGHHDLCAGALAGSKSLIAEARARAVRMGLGAAPLDAWLAQRGLRTLSLRMQRSQATARTLAPLLAAHEAVKQVHFPGWGALLSFDVGDRERAERLVTRCTHIRLTPSLGGTESSLSHSASSSHRSLTEQERMRLGIGEGLLRLSVGLEEADDIWSELAQALSI
jgi:cystathionine gamma-synthase